MKRRFPMFAVGILSFCAWQSRDLWDAWRHAPFDRLDPVVFVIWASPVAFAWARGRISGAANPTLLLITGVALLLGAISDMNVLQQVAMASGVACFMPATASVTPWLLASVAWMPVFGWCGSRWGLPLVLASRLLLALTAAAWEYRSLSSTKEIPTT